VPQAFTFRYDRRVSHLITQVKIGPPFNPENGEKPGQFIQVQAIWDTGATNTVITKRIADQCGFPTTGIRHIRGINGEFDSSTYLISMVLRNNVCISSISVSDGDPGGDIDVLIGMDIISGGDFAVTHSDGKTTLSFCFPSIHCTDFVTSLLAPKPPDQAEPTIARNGPCPCGSGKKYKYCCGAKEAKQRH
jgi:predicted aspartyl protease